MTLTHARLLSWTATALMVAVLLPLVTDSSVDIGRVATYSVIGLTCGLGIYAAKMGERIRREQSRADREEFKRLNQLNPK